jgi:hypothetical protein
LALADGPETEGERPAVLQVGLHLAQTHPVLTVESTDLADQPGAHLTTWHPVGEYPHLSLPTLRAVTGVLLVFRHLIAHLREIKHLMAQYRFGRDLDYPTAGTMI